MRNREKETSMIAELREKGQITIPKEIVKSLALSKGDRFEVCEKDGAIMLMPVVVYPRNYVDSLKMELHETIAKYEAGEITSFDNLDDMFNSLEGK